MRPPSESVLRVLQGLVIPMGQKTALLAIDLKAQPTEEQIAIYVDEVSPLLAQITTQQRTCSERVQKLIDAFKRTP